MQDWARAKPGELKDTSLGFALGMFEHMDLYKALVGGRGGPIAFCHIRDILCSPLKGSCHPTPRLNVRGRAGAGTLVENGKLVMPVNSASNADPAPCMSGKFIASMAAPLPSRGPR